ncbi:MAG: hypothetical protein HQL48_11275 [Gammaproteobacteria bacterium]|nr:hypothetical protein [Gammaproteobacteria bacterium]
MEFRQLGSEKLAVKKRILERNRDMNKIITFISAIAVSSSLNAADLIQFQSGTPAKASEVNANFSELERRIQTNSTAISNSSSNSGGSSQWQDYSNHIYYNNGNVGIGTSTPDALLTVSGSIVARRSDDTSSTARANVAVTNQANQYLQMEVLGSTESSTFFGLPRAGLAYLRTGSSDANPLSNFAIGSHTANLIFAPGDSEKMRIDKSTGNVGIGTTSPASKLAVSGLPTTAPDNSGNAGVVFVTNNGNFWLDNDGTADCQ